MNQSIIDILMNAFALILCLYIVFSKKVENYFGIYYGIPLGYAMIFIVICTFVLLSIVCELILGI